MRHEWQGTEVNRKLKTRSNQAGRLIVFKALCLRIKIIEEPQRASQGSSGGKECACNVEDLDSIPGS